jgi:hypothetical protein
MAVRIEDLRQDDLLTRYVVASRRQATQARPSAGGDILLARYLRAMERRGMQFEADPEGDDVRTCTHCGQQTHFDHDPSGGWGLCSACGGLA